MYNNNSAIIPRVTRALSGDASLGNEGIPVGFFSLRERTYFRDFLTLYRHSTGLMRDNSAVTDNTLIILRPLVLDPPIPNDQYVIETMNRTSFFNKAIISYKEKVNTVFASGDHTAQYIELKDVSENLTNCLLKTIYMIKGIGGINQLNDDLIRIIHGNALYNPDILKIYNVIMYSAPFMLLEATHGYGLDRLAFFHSPYNLIATSLCDYVMSFTFEDLTFAMKLQLQIEQYMPEMKLCKQLYNMALATYVYRNRIGIGLMGAAAIPAMGFIRYVPLIMSISQGAGGDNSIQPISRANDDSMDRAIHILFDIINNH